MAEDSAVLPAVIADVAEERLELSTVSVESAAEMLPCAADALSTVVLKPEVTVAAPVFTAATSSVTVEIGALSATRDEVAAEVADTADEVPVATMDWLSVADEIAALAAQLAASLGPGGAKGMPPHAPLDPPS